MKTDRAALNIDFNAVPSEQVWPPLRAKESIEMDASSQRMPTLLTGRRRLGARLS